MKNTAGLPKECRSIFHPEKNDPHPALKNQYKTNSTESEELKKKLKNKSEKLVKDYLKNDY